MTMEQLIRERAADIGVKVSLLISECRRRGTTHARRLVVRYVMARRPETTMKELAEFFDVSETAIKHWLTSEKPIIEPPKWPLTPEEILAEWRRKTHPMLWTAFVQRSRVKRVCRFRWKIVRDINERCPGISSTRLGKAMKMDHSSILYILGRSTRTAYKPPVPYANCSVSA